MYTKNTSKSPNEGSVTGWLSNVMVVTLQALSLNENNLFP